MEQDDNYELHSQIYDLEHQGLVTRTFRRLDPDRQEAMIGAILDEITEKGPDNLNIRNIAERSHTSIGSIYQYFTNRNGLLNFAMGFASKAINSLFKLSQPYLNQMPLGDGLRMYILEGVKMSHSYLSIMRFAARAAYQGDPELSESLVKPVALEMRHTVEGILSEARNRGEIRPDVDLEAATRVINALLITTGDTELFPYLNNYTQMYDANMPFERVVQASVDLILHGIASPPIRDAIPPERKQP